MGSIVFALFYLFCLLHATSALPLCTDSRAPFTAKSPLAFCSYNGTVCCDAKEDLGLGKRFRDMNISDPACGSLLKSILCASCDPFSAELFRTVYQPRSVPVLCNSTVHVNSIQSNNVTADFCSKVWNTCQNVPIWNSPFAPSLQGSAGVPTNSTSSKLTDLWQSQNDFCNAFGVSSTNGSVCFDGKPVSLNNSQTEIPPSGLCLEKIGNGSYLNMAAHPDGSDRAFFSDQPGKIWLATVPAGGSGGTLGIDQSRPFLDITDVVHFDTQFGLMGMAFHPDFPRNGRFFVSFNCNKGDWASCVGRCSCNSDAGCDPSRLSPDNGADPCQYHSVVAEYTVNSTSSTPSSVTAANPTEVRRIFTMGLPFTIHHAGQILFGPSDGYLYFMMGDGGSRGDPFNFSQNKKSLLGKIMRLDVDNMPSSKISRFRMEPPSKEWMTAPRLSKEYLEGVELFFRYVRANTHKLGADDWYCCPCVKCRNFRGKKTLREIHTHLICDGIDTSYTTWIHHGELYLKSHVNVGASDVVCGQVDLVNDVSQDGDNAQKNVRGSASACSDEDNHQEDGEGHDGTSENVQYQKLMEDAMQPLYP